MQTQASVQWRVVSLPSPAGLPSRSCAHLRLRSPAPPLRSYSLVRPLACQRQATHTRKLPDFSSPRGNSDLLITSSVAISAVSAANADVASALEASLVPHQNLNPAIGEVSAVLEAGVLLLYLGGLLSLLAFGTFLVVRQVLVRRELENAAKELQERVRSGQASSEEYFELGAVMLRKKFYTLANKYLLQAIQKWEGDEQELAQVHNALGFSYFSEEKWDKAVAEYEKAVKLQPAYVTAWNNMGDVFEKKRDWEKALKAYESSLMYDPSNRIANERREDMKRKVGQLTF